MHIKLQSYDDRKGTWWQAEDSRAYPGCYSRALPAMHAASSAPAAARYFPRRHPWWARRRPLCYAMDGLRQPRRPLRRRGGDLTGRGRVAGDCAAAAAR